MANLRDIKQRIVSVQSTSQITRTMEMVATAKIKKAQEKIEAARPYSFAMMEVLGNVARYVQGATHPLLEEHEERKRILIVTITSDRGLCGAFNSNILRITEDLIREADGGGSLGDDQSQGRVFHFPQRPAQRVFADELVHAQGLRCQRVAAQRGDVRVAPVPGQQPQQQRAQHVALVWCIAAAVL